MQLKTLLATLPVREIIGPVDRAVESIAYDSRRVQRDGLFVALRGEKSDGHDFIGQAIEKGATVIVADDPIRCAVRAIRSTEPLTRSGARGSRASARSASTMRS